MQFKVLIITMQNNKDAQNSPLCGQHLFVSFEQIREKSIKRIDDVSLISSYFILFVIYNLA